MNNLNLIIGEDKKLIDFYLTEILDKITYDNNKINYDLHEYSLQDIIDEASMISIIASTKVIIGNNFDEKKVDESVFNYLTKYVKNINKDAYIILITPKIDARLKTYKIFKDNFNIIDTTKLNNQNELTLYIQKTLKKNDFQMDKINIDYFLNKVGNDISSVNLELNKLMIYKEETKEIKKEDIDLLITDNIDNVIYEFTNAVLERNYDIITKMYNNFKIENVSIDYLLVSLNNVFRQCLIIKILESSGKSTAEIAKTLGKKEFYVKKMIERLFDYSKEDLCKYITKLANIDKNNKLGNSNIDELELFLIGMNH